MSIGDLSALANIAKLASLSPNEAKALIKLSTIDVLKSLGNSNYQVVIDGKTLEAKAENPALKAQTYWAEISKSGKEVTLSNLLKTPTLHHTLIASPIQFSLEELVKILKQPSPAEAMKEQVLQLMSSATSKEEFSALGQLLLSLTNSTLTLPFLENQMRGYLQLKKRKTTPNEKEKKQHIDFYTALKYLGPISGTITLIEESLSMSLYVSYQKSRDHLKDLLEQLTFGSNTQIFIKEEITPLYEELGAHILDINT